jgi:hypothetical protein
MSHAKIDTTRPRNSNETPSQSRNSRSDAILFGSRLDIIPNRTIPEKAGHVSPKEKLKKIAIGRPILMTRIFTTNL